MNDTSSENSESSDSSEDESKEELYKCDFVVPNNNVDNNDSVIDNSKSNIINASINGIK